MDGAGTQKALFRCTGVGEFELGDAITEFLRGFDRPVLSIFTTLPDGLYITTDPHHPEVREWHDVCDRRIIGEAIQVALKWFRGLDDVKRSQLASDPPSGASGVPDGWLLVQIPHESSDHRSACITPTWVVKQ